MVNILQAKGKVIALGILLAGPHAMAQSSEKDLDNMYRVTEASISFTSDAPLELIQAESEELKGILSLEGEFAFSVVMDEFEGFNSGLQREHFKENYLQTAQYPNATFSGRLIDPPEWPLTAPENVRVRGMLTVHGVSRERIISVNLIPSNEGLTATAEFSVRLDDHGIGIPKIMHQKIAESVSIAVRANLEMR